MTTKLTPGMLRLLADAQRGDVLLVSGDVRLPTAKGLVKRGLGDLAPFNRAMGRYLFSLTLAGREALKEGT